MPIGWLTVLQSVPWSEVIKNAPKVAEGAKKLWNAVAKNSPPQEASDPTAHAGAVQKTSSMSALESRVIALEASVSDLHGQMLASSELIQALADQNAQLIRRIETQRVRLLWMVAAVAAVALVSLTTALGLLPAQLHGV